MAQALLDNDEVSPESQHQAMAVHRWSEPQEVRVHLLMQNILVDLETGLPLAILLADSVAVIVHM